MNSIALLRRLAIAGLVAWPASSALAAPALGTLDDPRLVPKNPFALRDSTVGAPSAIDAYDCAPDTDESGPELVYAIDAPGPGKLTAWLEGDGGGVDVDVHIVVAPSLQAGVLDGCLARGNRIAEADVPEGAVLVVVDSFGGAAQAGEFVLRTTWIGDAWTESEPFEGVVWRAKRYANYAGGPQVVHELLVDPTNPAVRIEARRAAGCQTIGAMADTLGAVAAINGGYFASGCAPVSLLKHEGTLLGTNAVARSAFGLSSQGDPMIALVAVGADWPAAAEAHGGGPRLVLDGAALTSNADYAAEGITQSGFIAANPRTFAGIATDGRVAFVGVDGRRPTAAGMSLPSLATWSVALGLEQAVNLDGGGSTTVYVRDATPNGIVNYPSDAGDVELASHEGSRPVSGGFFVFSEPKQHPPTITTDPVVAASAGNRYEYDVDAYDDNPLDTIAFEIVEGPDGMAIDAETGLVDWLVPSDAPSNVAITLRATDGALSTEQSYSLAVTGGTPSGTGGGSGAGGESSASGVGGGTAGGGPATTASGQGDGGSGGSDAEADPGADGCACSVPVRSRRSSLVGALAIGLVHSAYRSRRRRRR
jgi:hypothetical protein